MEETKDNVVETAAEEETTKNEETVEKKDLPDDSNENIKDDGKEDPDFTDNSNENSNEKQDPNKGKNSFFAQMRREREAKEKANNQEENKEESAYLKGVIAGTGGKNPYTGQEIKDELDLREFKLMQELANNGKDPVKDYLEALKTKERDSILASKQEKEKEQMQRQKFTNEFNDFVNTYGAEKLDEISKNEEFTQFADMYIGEVPIKKIYERFVNNEKTIQERAEKLAIEKLARMKSSTTKQNDGENDDKPDYSKMSNEEFKKYKASRKR